MFHKCQRERHLRRTRKRSGSQRKGAALVEMAFVAPLMIVLTMGMMEFGRVIMVQQVLSNLSREGARLASLPEATAALVTSEIEQQLVGLSVVGGSVDISPSDISNLESGTPITVTLSVPAANISWVPNPVYTSTATLSAHTTMRREGR